MSSAASAPLMFSVVIPVFNRENLVMRSLQSCLSQDDTSFEVIVVDDGSTDRSAEVVGHSADPRVRLIRQPNNAGQCPARNRGASEARGEWIVFVDSDDELAPGALSSLRQWIADSDPSVKKFLLMSRWDSGRVSPHPPLTGEIWDYRGYVSWLESVHGRSAECLTCVQRQAFLEVPYPGGHSSEGIHDLDFARRFLIRGCPQIGRLYHEDSTNSFHVLPARRLRQIAPFYAANADETLARHGDTLVELAPTRFGDVLASGTLFHFLAGRRRAGLSYGVRYLRRRPGVSALATIAFGLLGPAPLAWLRESRDRLLAQRVAA